MNFSFNLTILTLLLTVFKAATAYDVDPYPSFRFRLHSELTDAEKAAASVLGYTEATWNQPGLNYAFEEITWYWNFGDGDYFDADKDGDYYDGDNSAKKAAAETLGFVNTTDHTGAAVPAEDIWDCWVSHYSSYYWSELVLYGIDISYIELGWTEDMWDNSAGEPESFDKYWAELTTVEKTAALEVGYTQKLWDEEMLPFCTDSNVNLAECDWVAEDLSRCSESNGAWFANCQNTCGNCVPTAGCSDATSKFIAVKPGDKGWTKAKTCNDWVTNKSTPWRCSKVAGAKEACPATCLNCCQDKTEPFIFPWNGKEKTCNWASKNVGERCQNSVVKANCPALCGVC